MYEQIANLFVFGLLTYAILGFVFALVFVSFGVQRIDPEAKGAGYRFRLIIVPGTTAFWPMLLKRWLQGAPEPPVERNPHQ